MRIMGQQIGRERIVGTAEIAGIANVKEQTVHAWRHRKILPDPDAIIGNTPIWREQTIVRWLQRTNRLPGDSYAEWLRDTGRNDP
jgi:hypothetical protein